jgi:hypothetical protein
MGMAGWVRLGGGSLRALPAGSECEIALDAEVVGDADGNFDLYPDLAEAMAHDGGFEDGADDGTSGAEEVERSPTDALWRVAFRSGRLM